MREHKENCFRYAPAKVVMPELGKNVIQFKDWKKKERAPYVIYADFESIIKKKSDTISIHEISGYSLCVVDFERKQMDCETYRDKDAEIIILIYTY